MLKIYFPSNFSIYLFFALLVIATSCGKKNNPQPSTTAQILAISDFNPKSGKAGSIIMITGMAFGFDANAVNVRFGSSNWIKPNAVSGTSMTATVPADAQTGPIQVIVAGVTATSTSEFTLTKDPVPLPTLIGFTPKSAKVGETVTITGTAFGADTNFVTVKFGASPGVKPKTLTSTSITVLVPANAENGKVQIAVNGGAPVVSADDFTLKPSVTIGSFSPKTVTDGDTLFIKGTNFGSEIDKVLIYLNRGSGDTGLRPLKVTPTEISVIVPYNASTGTIRVWVQNLGDANTKDNFIFLPPVRTYNATPTSARGGEIITLNVNFTSADLSMVSLTFAGSSTMAKPISQSGNYIKVRVPLDAQTGRIRISRSGFGTTTGSYTFTVLPQMPDIKSGAWTQRSDFVGDSKYGAFAFTTNGKAYVGGGNTVGFTSGAVADTWEYDPKYNAWAQVADFAGGARANAVAFAIGSKGYVGTGQTSSGTVSADFWEFDPSTNRWTKKADFKGAARAYAVGFAISNRGYIGTGTDGNRKSDYFSYDPSADVWTQIPSMPGIRCDAFAFVVNGKAYVGNGRNSGLTSSTLALPADLFMYDPATNAWTVKKSIPGYETFGSSGFSINGKGYVAGGLGLFNGVVASATNKVYEYSPETDSWKSVINLPIFTAQAACFAVDNVGYIGMGTGAVGLTPYKSLWAYKP